MDFSYELNEAGSSTVELQLKGYFDEFASLPEDFDYSKFTTFYVDFSKVEFINSGGIKLWVNFAERLENFKNLKIYFRKCRRMIVDQINMIDGFLPENASVISVYVPIFCNKCERSFEIFQDVKKIGDDFNDIVNRVDDPECGTFPKCKKEFEVDVVPENFFRFIK